ncbi:MAG: hypothetical protein CL891_05950 [Dehalococcoidia bacterium]|nr:hypothetical protein [Dehalococcoidia bacterium]
MVSNGLVENLRSDAGENLFIKMDTEAVNRESPAENFSWSQSDRVLEFHIVKERLAGHCQNSFSRHKALALGPLDDPEDMKKSHRETDEAIRVLQANSDVDISVPDELIVWVKRSMLDGVLKGWELYKIGKVLGTISKIHSNLGRKSELTNISSLALSLPDMKKIERDISHSIDPNGTILDDASYALRNFRSQAEMSRRKLIKALEKLIRKFERKGFLQESLITERNGRMVLMIKIESKNRIEGIVHDISDSGATAFLEPISTIVLGNDWREAIINVQHEEERLLLELTSSIGAYSTEIFDSIEILALIDLCMAKGKYSMKIGGTSPNFVDNPRTFISLKGVRHPLLPGPVVPVDLFLGDGKPILVISGPNAGGKTVALKSLGLTVLMAQSGLHVSATFCSMTRFDQVFANIGDHQSIDLSLSSFSANVQLIKAIIGQASSRSLVLLDELGTSTDPAEGAAFAKALLYYFCHNDIICLATTHQRGVANFVQEQTDMVNASVGLRPNSLEPTYTITTGLPGRSYALAIASRMGIEDKIIEHARAMLDPGERDSEKILTELEEQRTMVDSRLATLRTELDEAVAIRRKFEDKLNDVEFEKERILENYRSSLIDKAQALLSQLQKAETVIQAPISKNIVIEEKDRLKAIQKTLRSEEWRNKLTQAQKLLISELGIGDFLYLRGVGDPVKILSHPDNLGNIEVLMGSMKVRISSTQVEKKASFHSARNLGGISVTRSSKRSSISTELNLHGMRSDEAIEELDQFMDRAILEGFGLVKIIHGRGTGVLRTIVRGHLIKHPLVKDIRPGEGGTADGVTMVELN